MHKRTISARSGGRKPAVGRETHLQRRFRNCSVDCRPACWRTPLQSRCRKHGGGYAPPLLAVHAFVQRKSRFFNVERTTCTRSGGYQPAVARQAHLQMRYRNCSADCRRCVGERRCSGGSETTGSLRPPALVRALARRRNCDLCDAQTHMHQERRALARRGSGNVLAQAPPQMFGTLPTDVLAHVVAIAVA